MISQKTISELTSIAKKYSEDQINPNIKIGWFEDSRKEEKYTYKCPQGDFPLTKGLREGNKALIDTHFVPIKISNKFEIREVRFHDRSIIEILSNELGYAKYKVHSYNGKARYIKLRTSICSSINDCISDSDKKNKSLNIEKKERINEIIEKCIDSKIVRKVNNKYLLNNDLYTSIKKWCEVFPHFKNEENIFCQSFFAIDESFLDNTSVRCYIENERNKINYNDWLKYELTKTMKSNTKIYKNKIKDIKI